uniref:C2H2-type domain-containing protein n=1 Tax=Sparus aurata TaxID=8175 RepID=A0A671XDQ0_SPAAU
YDPLLYDCELSPSPAAVTVSVNESIKDKWNESDGSSSPQKPPREEKTCRFCGKGFKMDSHLIRHVHQSHNGHKAFKCLKCNKEFEQRYHLIVHVRIHTGEKPFSCDYCDKTFVQNSSRLTHMRVHTGEKPYFCCPYCKKLFAQSSNLYVHLRQHTGEKPYFCKSCGKMVAHSSHLKICGAREPKVKKKFRCLVCGKKFHTVSNLQEHINVHDARKPNTVVRPFLLIFPQPIPNVGIDSLVIQKKNNDSCC